MPEPTTADRCRKLRRRGMTQEELAEQAGVSVASVRKLEQGGQVRMETLHRLARALGIVTVAFASPAAPEPTEASLDEMVLAEIPGRSWRPGRGCPPSNSGRSPTS